MIKAVALILKSESRLVINAIASQMPVWIANTPTNRKFNDSLSSTGEKESMTWFPLIEGETLEMATVRIAYSLDDHYDDLAQEKGYKFLLVFGSRNMEWMNKELSQLSFKTFESTAFGFVAAK
jgi:hypothetical protein